MNRPKSWHFCCLFWPYVCQLQGGSRRGCSLAAEMNWHKRWL